MNTRGRVGTRSPSPLIFCERLSSSTGKFAVSAVVIVIMLAGVGTFFTITGDVDGDSTGEYSAYPEVEIYHPENDKGYPLDRQEDKHVFGSKPYIEVSLASDDGYIKKTTYNGFDAYGVNGQDLKVNLKINYPAAENQSLAGTGWKLSYDTWTEEVAGLSSIGQVGCGGVIVQTSTDGVNWSNENMARYTDGLYTTDYYTHHGSERTTIYTPDNKDRGDLDNGIYIRVIYAMEIYKVETQIVEKTHFLDFLKLFPYEVEEDVGIFENYVCLSEFFVVNDNVNGIIFSNQSVNDEDRNVTTEDGILYEFKTYYDTILTGGLTVTGFVINDDLCPSANIVVSRNGEPYQPSKTDARGNLIVDEDGIYDIQISTVLGTTKDVTIYVDRSSVEQTMVNYFGDGFIQGERKLPQGALSEDSLITFDIGAEYHVAETGFGVKPIGGSITNLSTGTVIEIPSTGEGFSGVLEECGDYACVFTTADPESSSASGDVKTFIFNFTITDGVYIPSVNYQNLLEYCSSSLSSVSSKYYGITFDSAGRGTITVAFHDYQSALNYAYTQEKASVEVLSNGNWIYSVPGQDVKVEYSSLWELTEALNEAAADRVNEMYFDMSDANTYLTLDNETLGSIDNLRSLSLGRSVTIFLSNSDMDDMLEDGMYISSQPFAMLSAGEDGMYDDPVIGVVDDFQFIKDEDGFESNTIVLTGNGIEETDLQYGQGLLGQLQSLDIDSGIYTITETNVNGGSRTYTFTYVEPGHNSANLDYYTIADGQEDGVTVSDSATNLSVSYLRIDSIEDELHAGGVVTVVKDGKTHLKEYYTYGEAEGLEFRTPGTYEISVIDRFGNTIAVNLSIEEQYVIDIILDYEDEDSMVRTHKGATNVALPEVKELYGYESAGYLDDTGRVYRDVIAEIDFDHDLHLRPFYMPKSVSVNYMAEDEVLETQSAEYGTVVVLPTNVDRAGYQLKYWTYGGQPLQANTLYVDSEESLTIIAVMEKTQAFYTFYPSGDDEPVTIGFSVGDIIEFPETGSGFTGWVDINGEPVEEGAVVESTDDRTFIAEYESTDSWTIVIIIAIVAVAIIAALIILRRVF